MNGFKTVGWIFLGAFLMSCLVGGIAEAFDTIPEYALGTWGRLSSSAIAIAAFVAISVLVERWSKIFSSWIAYGVYNSLFAFQLGHLPGNAEISVPRWFSLTMASLFLVSALTSRHFVSNYKLGLADKAALLFWVLAFAVSACLDGKHDLLGVSILGLATLALAGAWSYRRFEQKHRKTYHARVQTVS